MSSTPKVLFGFHAVGVRLKTAPASVIEIYYEPTRRDARLRLFLERVKEAGVRLIEADALRIANHTNFLDFLVSVHPLVNRIALNLGVMQAVFLDGNKSVFESLELFYFLRHHLHFDGIAANTRKTIVQHWIATKIEG